MAIRFSIFLSCGLSQGRGFQHVTWNKHFSLVLPAKWSYKCRAGWIIVFHLRRGRKAVCGDNSSLTFLLANPNLWYLSTQNMSEKALCHLQAQLQSAAPGVTVLNVLLHIGVSMGGVHGVEQQMCFTFPSCLWCYSKAYSVIVFLLGHSINCSRLLVSSQFLW